MLFTGAAEEVTWEGGTSSGTPCSLGTLAATGPCAAELSPTPASTAGTGGAESSRLPGEVRAGGRGALSLGGDTGGTSMGHTQDFMARLSWEAKCLGWAPLQARCCGECELGVPKGLGVLPWGGGGVNCPELLTSVSPSRAVRRQDTDQKVSRILSGLG